MEDPNRSIWALAEQINRKKPKPLHEVSSALQLGSPTGFLVILKKRWCFVWQNIPVGANKSRICCPTSHLPASGHWKSGKLFHVPFPEHPLTVSCAKGSPQWPTGGKGKETGWLQPLYTYLSFSLAHDPCARRAVPGRTTGSPEVHVP